MAIKLCVGGQPKDSVFAILELTFGGQKYTVMAFAMLSPDSRLENATGSYTLVLWTCDEFAIPFLFSGYKVNSSFRDMG